MSTIGSKMKLDRSTRAASLSSAIVRAHLALSSGDSAEFLTILGHVDQNDTLIDFSQGLTTVYYPLTPRQDLSHSVQRIYNFLDAILRLKGKGGQPSDAVRSFVCATTSLANPLYVDDLLSLIYVTTINELTLLLVRNKPGATNA